MSTELGKVFVAGPFSRAREKTGIVGSPTRDRLSLILDVVRGEQLEVFSAHERERWGSALDLPRNLARIDLEELRQARCLIAYLSSVPSFGTVIEVGVAVGLNKDVLILRDPNFVPRSDYFRGLVEIGHIHDHIWTSELEVRSAIERFVRR
jgi:Nucleoside 2-deoxyribosyltransferase